jgi:hypothetical protein
MGRIADLGVPSLYYRVLVAFEPSNVHSRDVYASHFRRNVTHRDLKLGSMHSDHGPFVIINSPV